MTFIRTAQYQKCEKFMKKCTVAELQSVMWAYSLSHKITRQVLVTVQCNKAQLKQRILTHKRHSNQVCTPAEERNLKTATAKQLQAWCKRLNISTTTKQYRKRTVNMRRRELVDAILYYTDYAMGF